jgi:hypothetical protein
MSLTTEGRIPEQRRMLDVDLYLSYVSLRHVYLRLFLPILCGLRIHLADPCSTRLREDKRPSLQKLEGEQAFKRPFRGKIKKEDQMAILCMQTTKLNGMDMIMPFVRLVTIW